MFTKIYWELIFRTQKKKKVFDANLRATKEMKFIRNHRTFGRKNDGG